MCKHFVLLLTVALVLIGIGYVLVVRSAPRQQSSATLTLIWTSCKHFPTSDWSILLRAQRQNTA